MEYYFNEGDQITCYECGTEYTILKKSPVKLGMLDSYEKDDYFGDKNFDDWNIFTSCSSYMLSQENRLTR